MNEHRQRIGQRIRDIRGALHLTQQELAARTGIQRCHIARIEAVEFFGEKLPAELVNPDIKGLPTLEEMQEKKVIDYNKERS